MKVQCITAAFFVSLYVLTTLAAGQTVKGKLLEGKKVAVLAENYYQEMELWYPYYRLIEEGAVVHLIGPKAQTYESKYGYPVKTEWAAGDVNPVDYDAVIVPGGYAPDYLRRSPEILKLVKTVFDRGGVVAAICHAAWVPISAGIVKGKKATCVSAIKDDLANAGATYLDQEVVTDGNLITSRTPADLPAFLPAIISALAKRNPK